MKSRRGMSIPPPDFAEPVDVVIKPGVLRPVAFISKELCASEHATPDDLASPRRLSSNDCIE